MATTPPATTSAEFPSAEVLGSIPDAVTGYQRGDHIWGVNDSKLRGYSKAFFGLDKGGRLLDVICDQLGDRDGLVGADIAGGTNGVALRYLIGTGVIDRGLVTNYEDRRSDYVRGLPHLDHLAGDILEKSYWNRLAAWQRANAPDGLDVVLHRPVGALQLLSPAFYEGAVHSVLDMMSEGSIMVAQIPTTLVRAEKEEPGTLRKVGEDILTRGDIAAVEKNQGGVWSSVTITKLGGTALTC